jgi:uncharacterized protein (TIGR00369 family)
MSPEDVPRGAANTRLDSVPFAQLLGIEQLNLSEASATLGLDVRADLLQNHGVVHGGVIASLVDTAAAFAVSTLLAAGETTTTIDLTIHYLRPVTQGRLTATAEVRRAGKRVIVLSVEVTDAHGETVATAVTAFLRRSSQ